MRGRGGLAARLMRPLLLGRASPTAVARGITLGLWVGLTPTFGVQMYIVALLAVPLRANIPLAAAAVWVSNPLTVVPIYFACYRLGALTLGVPARSYREVGSLLADVVRAIDLGSFSGTWHAMLEGVRVLGAAVGVPLCVGSFVLATVCAAAAYPVTLHWARRLRERKMRKAADRTDVQA